MDQNITFWVDGPCTKERERDVEVPIGNKPFHTGGKFKIHSHSKVSKNSKTCSDHIPKIHNIIPQPYLKGLNSSGFKLWKVIKIEKITKDPKEQWVVISWNVKFQDKIIIFPTSLPNMQKFDISKKIIALFLLYQLDLKRALGC